MTPARLSECADIIGWSLHRLAQKAEVNERTVRRWAAGEYAVPADVATWLDRLAAAHEANPVPRKSKTFEEATDEDKEVGSGSIWERPF